MISFTLTMQIRKSTISLELAGIQLYTHLYTSNSNEKNQGIKSPPGPPWVGMAATPATTSCSMMPARIHNVPVNEISLDTKVKRGARRKPPMGWPALPSPSANGRLRSKCRLTTTKEEVKARPNAKPNGTAKLALPERELLMEFKGNGIKGFFCCQKQ